MDDRYLWDKSGPADPEVARLERLLAPRAWAPDARSAAELERALADGPARASRRVPARATRPPRRLVLAGSLAAVAALVVALALLGPRPDERRGETERAGYRVHGLAGRERVAVGEELVVAGEATLEIADLGEVTVEPGSRVGVVAAGADLHRLTLAEGALRARILAPPRLFQVDTPAGLTTDLGCEYTLRVLPDGSAEMAVLSGQVAFELDGREVYVPAGAACTSSPATGPSAPLFADAAPAFRAAVERAERAPEPASADLDVIAGIDRREDGLTLFHLLDAPSPALRERAFARLSDLFPKPPGATDAELRVPGPARAAWLEAMKPHWRVAGWRTGVKQR